MERCVIGDTRRATLDALHASAVAFEALRYAGVAYLLYMAWMTWCESGALAVDEDSSPRSALRVITSGILVNILNPELTIFFFASCRSSSVPTTRTGWSACSR
jgi:threonine/homoserine/homoserine lactone efflux protein